MITPKTGLAAFAYFTLKIHIRMVLHRKTQRVVVAANLQFSSIPDSSPIIT